MIKKKNTKKRGTTKKKVTKYQAGGITQNQYADNVIPGAYNPTTAHISANQSDPAVTASLVKRQEELGTEVDLTQVQADGAARANNVDTVANTALTAGKTFAKAGTKAGLIGKGATAGAGTLKAGMLAYKGARATKAAGNVIAGGKTAAGVGLTAAGWAGPQAVGTAAAMLGKGIEKKYDDNDVTTMNAGETTGKVIKGAGYGAAAAGLAGSLGAFGATMSWNPVGWAALAAGAIAGGVGLLQRRKGRRAEAKATTTFDNKQAEINKDRSTQETKDLTTTGYDFGNNFGMPGAMGSEQMIRRQTGGKYKMGGTKLPGGEVKSIAGSSTAKEYTGNTHDEGGIMVDSSTEVENKETEDVITMNGGGKSKYFFSNYLKVGGKSFANQHKSLVKEGASQKQLDGLAAIQEKVAGRDSENIQVAQDGGEKIEQYQAGGANKTGLGYDTEEYASDYVRNSEYPISLPRIGINSIEVPENKSELIRKDEEHLDPIEEESFFTRAKDLAKGRDYITPLVGAAQMLPALKASKTKADYVSKARRTPKVKLDRVNMNSERSTNAARLRALNKQANQAGTGPAGIAIAMANKANADRQEMEISAQEDRTNSQIDNTEKSMNQSASARDIANEMTVNEYNSSADAAVEDRKLDAYNSVVQSLAGMNRDRLAYKAETTLSNTIAGDSGIMDRMRLKVEAARMAGATSGEAYDKALADLTAATKTEKKTGGFLKSKK